MSLSVSRQPDWADAPEWAKWLAQDKDGLWAWFSTKPQPHNFGLYADGTFLASGDGHKEGCSRTAHTLTSINQDWRKTVTKRPTPDQIKASQLAEGV